MLLHAAFGGSTNLLLHIPAIAHAAGLRRPTVDDWHRINKQTPRLVDALPERPAQSSDRPGVHGGRRARGDAAPARGWACSISTSSPSPARRSARSSTGGKAATGGGRRAPASQASDGVDPDRVIMSADAARANGLASTVVFPVGNVAPEGSVIKATAIAPSVIGRRRRLPASRTGARLRLGARRDRGDQGRRRRADRPQRRDRADRRRTARHGDGRNLPAHLRPQVHPVGRDGGDRDRRALLRRVDRRVHRPRRARGAGRRPDRQARRRRRHRDRDRPPRSERPGQPRRGRRAGRSIPRRPARLLASRAPHPELRAHPDLPDDTRLWAALQAASGGPWAGCVYDVDRIIEVITAGLNARSRYSK